MTPSAPKRSWTPSPEQEAVRAALARPSGSVMVEAGAGCAKSSTLEFAAPGIRQAALALAFNKSIADGLAKRLPGNFQAKTMNALGHAAWCRAQGGAFAAKLDARKLGGLVSQMAKDRRMELTSEAWTGVREMVEKVMQWGVVPQEEEALYGPGMAEDLPQTWLDAAAEVGLGEEPGEELLVLGQEVLREDIRLARQGTMSFDDQVYCSALLGGKFPLFPAVMVDENQDLSPLNHKILGLCLRPGGRLITVGDRHQAIYGFRGASGDSARQIRKLVPEEEWTDLGLMTTYRCPKAVVARQQDHVPGYTVGPGAPEGLVHVFPQADDPEGEPWGWRDLQNAMTRVQNERAMGSGPGGMASLAVLCRNNAPLLRLAMRLLRQRIGVHMLGRDIGKGLQTLLKKLAPQPMPLPAFAGRLLEWENQETALAEANGRPDRKAGIQDKAECLRAVMDTASLRDTGDLGRTIEGLFARDTGLVTLSSIHRAKGLEWDVVVHLDPWRISAAVRRARAAGDEMGMRQELNLRYVAETRTKHTLLLGSVEDFR